MTTLYCYVDETGQDTKGNLFIVAVVVVGEERDELLAQCEHFEKISGKGKFKWGKAKENRRLDYFQAVVSDLRFQGILRYSIFRGTTDYHIATIEGIAKALQWNEPQHYATFVYVDGLAQTKCREYTRRLRRLGVPVRKVRGIRKDEHNALIRLADAVAGFVRDAIESRNGDVKALFERAEQEGFLVHIGP